MDAKQFLKEFGHIASAPNGVQRLREMIRQLAIQGGLTKHNDAGETAHKLLEIVEIERLSLIKNKRIKRRSKLPSVPAKHYPFSIPQSWAWCRLGHIATYAESSKIKGEIYLVALGF